MLRRRTSWLQPFIKDKAPTRRGLVCAPCRRGFLSAGGTGSGSRVSDAGRLLVERSVGLGLQVALDQRERRVVPPHGGVRAGVELGAALAHDEGAAADES